MGFAGQLVDHLVFGVDVVEGLANLDENAILIAGKVAAVDAGHPAFAVVGLAIPAVEGELDAFLGVGEQFLKGAAADCNARKNPLYF